MHFPKIVLTISVLSAASVSCRPKPIDIAIPQAAPAITVSSVVYDAHTVFVSAGYSVSSFANLDDTANDGKNAVKGLLIDDGLVTIAAPGQTPDTLTRISAGLYGSRTLNLEAGVTYTVCVKDRQQNTAVTATTTFLTKPEVESVQTERIISGNDTMVKMRIRLKKIQAGNNYFISYASAEDVRKTLNPIGRNIAALHNFSPKRLELINGDEAAGNMIDKTITLQTAASDTLIVNIGAVDKSYFNYLSAYKRTGYLINQLTGEPINLPTNVVNGLGYFSLFVPERKVVRVR